MSMWHVQYVLLFLVLVSKLHTFTQAARSYALLSRYIPVLICFCVIMNTAHMWYSDEIHEANTNEDQHNPERTRRVRTLMFFDEIDLRIVDGELTDCYVLSNVLI